MFNVMLDKLPTEYKGYPINSDFRIGIQIFQALSDNGLTDMEKMSMACELMFDVEGVTEKLPDMETIQEGIQWFLSGWYTDNPVKGGKEESKDMDYDVDQWRIFSAFLTQFGINLNESDMHFWVFMGLLSTLEECAFTRIVDIRTKKVDPKMKPSDKAELRKVKERYALEQVEEQLTPQEQEEYDTFMKYAKKRGRIDR
ncbi:hypothetical protein D3Z36_14510 [Lachnospiraceae bacterium]|nr:hypothetical protein [Lachnospiraceae bacterium]